MREIKFRVWDGYTKTMVQNSADEYLSINDDGRLNTCSILNTTIPMQYTGLKDKNEKEIYEGDIVFIVKDKFSENKDEIWAIEYDTSTASFVAFNQLNSIRSIYESYRGVGFNIIDDFSIIEIIGNIYENPELLT